MVKKLLASIMIALVLFTSVSPTVASAQWYNQSFQEFHEMVFNPATPPQEIFGERYTYAQVQWIIYSLIDFIINMGTNNNPEFVSCAMTIAGSGTGDSAECSALLEIIGSANVGQQTTAVAQENSIKTLAKHLGSNKPLSGVTIIKTVLNKINPVHTANAQTGFGYDTAFGGMIQGLWRQSRNIAYSLFIFFAIILAFMIMFRVKLNPQTVVSIQSAIPKLFITLILVTFSYAIAGFMVDLMYVVIGLIGLMFDQIIETHGAANMFDLLTTGIHGTGIWGFMFMNIIAMPIVLLIATAFALGLLGSLTAAGVIALLIASSGGAAGPILLFLIFIPFVIFLVMLLIVSFRTLKTMIVAYAEVLLYTIFGPIFIAIGVIAPGMGFGAWLKKLIASLAVFPLIGVLFSLSYIFLIASLVSVPDAGLISGILDFLGLTLRGGIGNDVHMGGGWPPLLAPISEDGLGQVLTGTPVPLILFAVSFVIYSMIPRTDDLIKGFLSGRMFPVGTAIGEAVGPVYGVYARGRQGVSTGIQARIGESIYTRAPGGGRGEKLVQAIGMGFGYKPPPPPKP